MFTTVFLIILNYNCQVFEDLLSVVDSLTGNGKEEQLASAQVQGNSSKRLLEALDNFITKVDAIQNSMKNKSLILSNISTQFSNIAFNISRDLFTRDVFFIARVNGENASVSITTDARQSELSSNTTAVIKIPKETFLGKTETLYSYQFTKPSLFPTETQLKRTNENETQNNRVVASNVLSAKFLKTNVQNLTKPVLITFKKTKTQNWQGILHCQFWNPNLCEYFPNFLFWLFFLLIKFLISCFTRNELLHSYIPNHSHKDSSASDILLALARNFILV